MSESESDTAAVPASSLGLLSTDDRYDVWHVKTHERPALLKWSGEQDETEEMPLLDGCDVPGWRKEGLVSASQDDIAVLNVGSACAMLRRESQLPVLGSRHLESWNALRDKLMMSTEGKRMPLLSREGVYRLDPRAPWFEVENVPVAFDEGCTSHWKWPEDVWKDLVTEYGDHVWRCSDTHAAGLSLRTYDAYCRSLEGRVDDAPLAVYDSQFHADDRVDILENYDVWPCFDRDLFACCGEERRPPFRWILMGPARSGTGLHVDPLGTHAWVSLLQGRKRWVLFSPEVDRQILRMSFDDDNADAAIPSAIWFARHYEEVTRILREQNAVFVEFLQSPGQTVYVPAGWPHLVLNLDDHTVAVTHNYASEHPSLDRLVRHCLREEPEWVRDCWLPALERQDESMNWRVCEVIESTKGEVDGDTDSTASTTSRE